MSTPFDDVLFGDLVVARSQPDRFVAMPTALSRTGSDSTPGGSLNRTARAPTRIGPPLSAENGAFTSPTFASPASASPTLDPSAFHGASLAPPPLTHDDRDLSVLGQLEEFAHAPGLTDLCVNGRSGLWTDTGAGLVRQPEWHLDEAGVRALAVRLIALGGRHIDEASPCVDVRLGDGIRVHAVLPPISSSGTLLSIRLPSPFRLSLASLASAGMFGTGQDAIPVRTRLQQIVEARENFLITGAAGSGKTTLLAGMLGEVPPGERIVVIEDVAELRIAHPHVVGLEARQANLEGAGRVGLERLVREALRMRPDRLILGECRGGEVRELLAALNTGHDGGAGTLHANSVSDVPARLEALGALAGMSHEAVARQTVSAVSWVLHVERTDAGRRLGQIARFELDASGRLAVSKHEVSPQA